MCVSMRPPSGRRSDTLRLTLVHQQTGLRVGVIGRTPRPMYAKALRHLTALVRAYEVLDLPTPADRAA
jgi:hypothetical protein